MLRDTLKTPSGLHRGIQILYLVFSVALGLQFGLFVAWLLGKSPLLVPRPPAVEAFLPISALLALRRLILTGNWDPVHPAGLVIFLFALLTALLLRKSFCGYICPGGTLSFWLFRLGQRLGLTRNPPAWLTGLLALPKYLLLAFFLQATLRMSLPELEAFLNAPFNLAADSKMLFFFLPPDRTVYIVLALLILGSLVLPSFWCRCFCPYGALLGLISLLSPLAMRRETGACTGCGRCRRACPQGIAVDRKTRVCSTECTGCQECASVCPQRCLSLHLDLSPRPRPLPWQLMGAATVGLLLLLWLWARLSGHWVSQVPLELLRSLHENLSAIQHY